MKIFISCFIFWLLFLNFSCKEKNKKIEVLTFDTMKVVVLDLLIADEWNNILITKDSTLKKTNNNLKLYQQVFFIHHISKNQFYYSYQFYEQHPDKFKALMDSVYAFGSRQKYKTKIKPI